MKEMQVLQHSLEMKPCKSAKSSLPIWNLQLQLSKNKATISGSKRFGIDFSFFLNKGAYGVVVYYWKKWNI